MTEVAEKAELTEMDEMAEVPLRCSGCVGVAELVSTSMERLEPVGAACSGLHSHQTSHRPGTEDERQKKKPCGNHRQACELVSGPWKGRGHPGCEQCQS